VLYVLAYSDVAIAQQVGVKTSLLTPGKFLFVQRLEALFRQCIEHSEGTPKLVDSDHVLGD
jgi:hypothetical protein